MTIDERPILEGKYRLERILGQGGTARTWLATDIALEDALLCGDEPPRDLDEDGIPDDARVAIKELPLSRLREWKDLDRFEKEAEMLASLDHPGIPASTDSFLLNDETGATFYLVQEWVEGDTLAAMLKRGETFNEARVTGLLGELCTILVYLHSRKPGIIHRDIKPSNIIVRPDGRATLIDFGAGRQYEDESGSSTVVGTFGYMPPEQLRGRPVPASDIYALGATMCHLLTGREPSDMPSGSAVFEIDFRPWCNVSDGFADLLAAMLKQDPNRRLSSARDVLRHLDALATGTGLPFDPGPMATDKPRARFDEDAPEPFEDADDEPAPSTALVRRETGMPAAVYSWFDLAPGWRYVVPALGLLFLIPPLTPIGVMLLLCGAFVCAPNLREGYHNHQLLSRGSIQPATVEKLEASGGRYKLQYAYTVHRQTYRAQLDVPLHFVHGLRPGASIQVAVDPYVPEDSVPLLGRMRELVK